MAIPVATYYTADMVRALPDDSACYEVVHGELLVNPAPRPWHEEVALRLIETVRGYLRRQPVGHAFGLRADLSWGQASVLVCPDLFVVPVEEARLLHWPALRSVLLVAEVLSPASKRADRFTKRRLYQERGIPLYWILDPDANGAELWTPEADFPRPERRRLHWHPAGAVTPFTLELTDLFRPI